MAKKKSKNLLGKEPSSLDCSDPKYQHFLGKALDWYNFEIDKSQGKVYLKQYLDATNPERAAKLNSVNDSKLIPTFLWVARLISTGSNLSVKHVKALNEYLDFIFKDVEVSEKVSKKPDKVISIQERVRLKAAEIIGELEGAIDDFYIDNKEFDLFGYLNIQETPVQYCVFVKEWIVERKQEYIEVYEGKDEQLKEGYSNFKRTMITKFIKFFSRLEKEIDSYVDNKKSKRIGKPKRVKPISAQVAKVKYLKEYPELNLQSILPQNIVGASQVWIYNVKYKKLTVIRTDAKSGLQINGSSIVNYDPDNSEQKTLRKPQDILPKVLEAGKIPLRKLMNDINSKENPAKNRLNENCIILRALK